MRPRPGWGIHFRTRRYVYHIRTMWTLGPDNIDQIQQPSHIAKKRMATVFFNGTGLLMIDILPQNQKMDAEYFAEYRAYSMLYHH
jgi:hypothetical protein